MKPHKFMFTIQSKRAQIQRNMVILFKYLPTKMLKVKLEWQKRIFNQKETWNVMRLKTSLSKYINKCAKCKWKSGMIVMENVEHKWCACAYMSYEEDWRIRYLAYKRFITTALTRCSQCFVMLLKMIICFCFLRTWRNLNSITNSRERHSNSRR